MTIKKEEELNPLNSQQRRLLKRAQEREAVTAPAPPATSPTVPTSPGCGLDQQAGTAYKEITNRPTLSSASASAPVLPPGGLEAMNAKERRMYKRALERYAAEAGSLRPVAAVPAVPSPPKKPQPPAPKPPALPPGGLEAMNAKERRMYKRALERYETDMAAYAQANGNSGKKRKRVDGTLPPTPHIVFVGQLAFKTTAEALRMHLEKGGVAGRIQIRLLTDKGTGKSRGQAFVTLDDAENQYKCLSLHHSKLDGRVINVERSCGGRNTDRRKEKITARRGEQKEAVQTTCDRIVKEKTEAGLLKEGELDEQALGLLTRYDGSMASAILETYCAEDRDRLRNPSAFFMMLAKRVVEEGVEAVQAASAAKKNLEGERKDKGRGAAAAAAAAAAAGGGPPKKAKTSFNQGSKPAPLKEEHGGTDQEAPEDEDEEGDDDEEERGWGTPRYTELTSDAVDKSKSQGGSRGGGGRGDDYYDISQVFSSMRGRGGFGGAARGGRGGRAGGGGAGRGIGGGGRGR